MNCTRFKRFNTAFLYKNIVSITSTSMQFNVSKFYLPPITMLEKSKITSKFKDDLSVKTEVDSWAKLNLKKVTDSFNPSQKIGYEYASFMYPYGKLRANFVLMSKFLTFLFAYDDVDAAKAKPDEKKPEKELKDVNANKFDAFIQVFEGTREPTSNTEKLLHSFAVEIRSTMSQACLNRLVLGMKLWVGSMHKEQILKQSLESNENDMSVDQYLKFRADNGGAVLITAIGEAIQNLDTSGFLTENNHKFDQVFQACANHLSLVNDLYSFRKEYFDKDMGANILFVLAHHHQFGIDKAVETTKSLIDQNELDFYRLRERILNNNPTDSEIAYLNMLLACMQGNIAYSQQSPRYHGTKEKILDIQNGGWLYMNPEYTCLTN